MMGEFISITIGAFIGTALASWWSWRRWQRRRIDVLTARVNLLEEGYGILITEAKRKR